MKTPLRLLHWLPRVLCVLAIVFISLFAADAFAPGLTIWQQLGAFCVHLIPSFVLLAFLLVAWKWERLGGIVFVVTGLALSPLVFQLNYRRTHSVGVCLEIISVITMPFVLVGILFIVSSIAKRRKAAAG